MRPLHQDFPATSAGRQRTRGRRWRGAGLAALILAATAAAVPTFAAGAPDAAVAGEGMAEPVAPPTPPADLPPSFRPLPELAAGALAAAESVAADVEVSAGAWGDPAMECYLLVERVRFRSPAADVAEAALEALGAASGLAIGELTRDGDRVGFAFTRPDLQGQGRLEVDAGSAPSVGVDLVACFHGPRYPARAGALCAALLQPRTSER
jgi:hypothetical protein